MFLEEEHKKEDRNTNSTSSNIKKIYKKTTEVDFIALLTVNPFPAVRILYNVTEGMFPA